MPVGPSFATLPGFTVFRESNPPMGDYLQGNPFQFLGYLTPGPHTFTVELHKANSITTVAAQAESTFNYQPSARTSLIYENRLGLLDITKGAPGSPGLNGNRGGLIQKTTVKTTGYSQAGRLSGRVLSTQTAREMADYLKAAINSGCGGRTNTTPYCKGSGVIAVDEITPAFADWTPAEIVSRGKPSPGTRLEQALGMLNGNSLWGFSYRSKVHLYVAGTVLVKMASGSSYRTVERALAAAGGTWLEMYTGTGGRGAQAFSAAQWRTIPSAIARATGKQSNLHFLMTSAVNVPRVSGCTTPMSCQWALAASTPVNRAILANGPGTYRASDQAAEWLQQFNRRFPE